MKPLCQAENDYDVWRREAPFRHIQGFKKYGKRLLSRARRRYYQAENRRFCHQKEA